MDRISIEQVRRFRLHAHHLDAWYRESDAQDAVGACGMQNTPPNAWETALHNRVFGITQDGMRQMLETDKTLLQAWSFRGTPVIFPTSESDAFLSALVPGQNEPWIYTHGIQLALNFLGMGFDEVLHMLIQAIPRLDDTTLKSKVTLDRTLAEWMLPLLPPEKQDLWNKPSMYGSPDKQTVGGAVVSFLLRPCSFLGLVVFGRREGVSPTFTSYRNWTGGALLPADTPGQKLVRKYLHCYGPATVGDFADWLGCSPSQAQRIWQTVADEIEPVSVAGKTRYILSADSGLLSAPPKPARQLHLLGGHDPYLGLQDRATVLEDKAKQHQLWQTVSNPGAVLWQGGVAGFWKGKKKGKVLEVSITLWDNTGLPAKELRDECESYAAFRKLELSKVDIRS